MGNMNPETCTPQPMFPHDVPGAEPPVGTVAAFYSSFVSGGGAGGNMMIRTENGWSTDHRSGCDLRSWAELTDLETMNARVQARNPGSPVGFSAVQVVIIAGPIVGAGE